MATRYKQESPFCIQVEPTEGCNLYCNFCGLQGIREQKVKNFKFMSVRTAKRIASDIADAGWNPRIEFAMHGEPTMNPDLVKIIQVFREKLPKHQLMITSNGGGLLGRVDAQQRNKVEQLFDVGLNILALDWYEDVSIVPKVVNMVRGGDIEVRNYPEEKDASPHRRWPKSTQIIVVIKDISTASSGVHATLNNHCGGGAPLDFSANGKRCAKPFRELSIRWNGKISICCNDFRGVSKYGDIHTDSLENIWNNSTFHAARKMLYAGKRTFNPCYGCNAKSYRTGLLPDKKGTLSMATPTRRDEATVKAASTGRSLTIKVNREWE